jgi:hypothetical protein
MAALIKTWLWISAFASVAGWSLSAFGVLSQPGYLVAIVLCFACPTMLLARGVSSVWSARSAPLRKLRRRFRRWLPAAFLVLAGLALLGGMLYPPSNYAGLTYRTPRVLQWLSEGHWFWIHTLGPRLNTRSCGFEWLSAPIFLFTRSDRALFLLNFIPFLLLPGIIYSVFTRFGIRPRVAWHWMWLLPTGYNFLLQAGSISNDTFPTVYALAAVDFGLRAWKSRRSSDLYYSLIAAALLTGAKPSNIPLLLPWLLLAVPMARLLLLKPLLSAVMVLLAAAVSFLPNAILNIIYCGDWSGLRLERAGMEMKEPLVGVVGNTFLILLNNLVPPFFPMARWWNDSAQHFLPQFLVGPMNRNFELGYLTLWEMPGEDWVGIGFGITMLVFVAVVAGFLIKRRIGGTRSPGFLPEWLRRAVVISPWIALLAYAVKSGMVTPARIISPYYPLLIAGLLTGAGQAGVVRRFWWRALTFVTVLIALAVLVLTPARPLWPAQTVLGELTKLRPGLRLAERALNVYQVYQVRSDPIPQLRQMLPSGLKVVGFLGDGDDLDISLWRPFFSRRVCHVLLQDTAEEIRKRGIEYIVVGGAYLKSQGVALDEWLARTGAERAGQTRATLKVTEGPQDWFIVRLPGK